MKKALMLFTLGVLTLAACQKTPTPETTTPDPEVTTESKDASLQGTEVDVKWFPQDVKKVFVLNEGQLGANNATLDFLRVSDGQYVTGAFKKMNPSAKAGLGDVGNDIALHNNEVWMVINNSGLVEVVSAEDETEIAVIEIPTPRAIAFDDKYAYVTSWAGAFVQGSYDANGNYTVTGSANPKGCVYRIDLSTYKADGTVEVGYQPEGIAYYDGKLYVANSGGIASQLPPMYAYDNTVSIIDAASFKVTQTVEVEVNLKNVYAAPKGYIYVTSLGNYYDVHSGLYVFKASDPTNVGHVYSEIAKHTHVSCSCIFGDTVYCIGTENEFDFYAEHRYTIWSHNESESTTSFYPVQLSGTPYAMAVLSDNFFLVGDAGDYFNPGTLNCYGNDDLVWSVTAGVCPGHFAVWK